MSFTVGSFVETPEGVPGIVVQIDRTDSLPPILFTPVCKVYELEGNVTGMAWWYPENDLTPRSMKDLSDHHHTFRDLYRARMLQTAALCRAIGSPGMGVLTGARALRSLRHATEDAEPMFDDSFIVVIVLPGIGQVRYHYPIEYWYLFNSCETVERAPVWDGAPSGTSLARLQEWITGKPPSDCACGNPAHTLVHVGPASDQPGDQVSDRVDRS